MILNIYEQDGMQITEYTKDGKTVSHIVKVPIPQEIEPFEPQPALEHQIQQLQQSQQMDNTVLLMALTDLYAEIQSLKGGDE